MAGKSEAGWDRCLRLLGLNITLIGGIFGFASAVNGAPVDGLTAATLTVALGFTVYTVRRPMFRLLAGMAFLLASYVITLARMKITVGDAVIDNIYAVLYSVPGILSGLYALSTLSHVKLELRSKKPARQGPP